MTDHKPDIIVAWLQNDYGQLARAAECIAHSLVDLGLARRVAYVEPVIPGSAPGVLEVQNIRGVWRFQARGIVGDPTDMARAVIAQASLENPILLNCGVAEANWWFHTVFAPFCSHEVLVTHDMVHLWPGIAAESSSSLMGIRSALIRSSELVLGCSTGSIVDIPQARYVGHGHDPIWSSPDIDNQAEPAEFRGLPAARVVYFGILSVRIDVAAVRALAEAGLQVIIIGFAATPELEAVISDCSNILYLGPKSPLDAPRYLLHCQVGIVPHTDEPFTWSMEPQKVYNYASAGLRSVLLNCEVPPRLKEFAISTTTTTEFIEQVFRATKQGRLTQDEIARARSYDWGVTSSSIMNAIEAAF